MGDRRKTEQELLVEVQELRRRLQEAEEALQNRAARSPAGTTLSDQGARWD